MRYFPKIVLAVTIGWSLGAASSFAATVEVVERSEPAGIINRTLVVETPTEHRSGSAPMEVDGLRFTHWTVNNERIEDLTGRAMNPPRFWVYETIDAVAHYMNASEDEDSDRIPDWYEINVFGDLGQDTDSDADEDGLTLEEEYRNDCHPGIFNTFLAGGISVRNSGLTAVMINPALLLYSERSEPDGLEERLMAVSNGTVVVSSRRGDGKDDLGFAYWTLNGVRQSDAAGMSKTHFSVTLTSHVEAVAWYLPLDQDSVGEGLPDWWQLRHFGHLETAADSDADGDGLTLIEEYQLECNPIVSNAFESGGISMRNGDSIVVNLTGFYNWSIQGDPEGLMASQSGLAQTGRVFVTSNLGYSIGSYQFGFWTLNGERQADLSGSALSRLSFIVTTNMSAVAHFFQTEEDNDANGLPDWWEYRYFGTTSQDPTRGLGESQLTLADAYRFELNPVLSNTFVAGGISMRNSEMATVNLQPFERVRHVLRNGILTPWFSSGSTGSPGVAAFGAATAPALGDWDGDGDVDLFITTTNGSLNAFENIGSRYTLDLAERPAAASALASRFGALDEPLIAFGDWSGDGRADLVTGDRGDRIWLLSSTGHFNALQEPATCYAIDLGAEAGHNLPALMDVTGDSLPDLLVLQGNGAVCVLAHRGDPGRPYDLPVWTNDLLTMPVPAATGISPADINCDGRLDLLVSDQAGRIWEFRHEADGRFVLLSRVWAGTAPGFASRLAVAAADLDGDGDDDAMAGFEQGGLMFLRDPRLGPPSNVRAVGGADSVALTWEPDRQTRVKGYAVYRSTDAGSPYARLNPLLLDQPFFDDFDTAGGQTYFYYITAATLAYFPGSTVGALRESPPSEVVTGQVGAVRLWMQDYSGDRGQMAVLKVNLDRAEGVSGQGLSIGIRYDTSMLTPVSQVFAQTQTVRRTALTENLVFSDNTATADGEIVITGLSGSVLGAGCLFDIVFHVSVAAPPGAVSTNAFTVAQLRGASGQGLTVSSTDTAVFTVTAVYQLGDASGDGILDMNDHALLLLLLKKDAREPTPQELYACDINGDGELTQRDIPLLLRLIQGKPVNP